MITTAAGEQVWVAETPEATPSAGAEPGRRELVLCVHGMSGAATNWTDLMAELGPDFDCAALDLPGSGLSPPPRTPAGYSVSALAGTVIRLIEALGAAGRPVPVHLVGNSMGGSVAIRVAARRPDLVRTLTLISPALPDLRVRRSVAHFPLLGLPFVGEWLLRQWVVRFPAENRVAGVYAMCFSDPSRLHPDRFALEVAALRRRDALGYNATSLARAARTLVAETLRPAPFSLWRAAARITAPSLVLFAADDRLVHPRLAARAARTFQAAQVAVLPGAGHIAQMECPAAVAGRLRDMVRASRAPADAGAGPRGRSAARGMPAVAARLWPEEEPFHPAGPDRSAGSGRARIQGFEVTST
jgi:pimeloyl-ACP methyl ester carboxylesterase